MRMLAVVVALGACGVDPEVPEDNQALPSFSLGTDLVTGIVGKPTTITVAVTQPDGTPASNYEMNWYATCSPSYCELSSRQISPGLEELTILPVAPGYWSIAPFLLQRNFDGTSTVDHSFIPPPVRYSVASDEPMFMPMLNRGVTIVVGEKRAVTAGTYNPTPNGTHLSGVPLTFTIDDPAIASVDADGVVTGLAPGRTRMTIDAKTVSRNVTIQVNTGTIGPPPINTVHAIDEDGVYASTPQPAHWRPASELPHHTIVVDSRGYPHLIFKVGQQAGVASWSGTGFGFELFPERFEPAEVAALAIDELDHLYAVVYTGEGSYLVYDKLATAPPSAWKRRKLHNRWALGDRAGQAFEDYALEPRLEPQIAVTPRKGGGIDVAYHQAFNTQWNFTGFSCVAVMRLAEISETSIISHEVTETWAPYRLPEPLICGAPGLTPLIPSTTGGVPEIAAIFPNPETPLYTFDGTRWSASALVPSFLTEQAATDSLLFPIVAPPVPGTPEPAVGAAPYPRPLPGEPAELPSSQQFLLQGNDHLYLGSDTLTIGRPLFGEMISENLINAFHDDLLVLPFSTEYQVFGVASSGTRIHFFADHEVSGTSIPQQLVYLTRTIPARDTRTTDSDTIGTRIADTAKTALIQAPPIFLADGTRVFVARSYNYGLTYVPPQLLVSTSPAAGWQASGTGMAGERQLWAVGNEIYSFANNQSQHLLRSTDRGQTATVASAPVSGTWLADAVFPSGVAANLYLDPGLGHILRIAANVVGQATVTFTAIDLDLPALATDEASHRFLAAPTGFYHVATHLENFIADRLFLRQYAPSGAILLERYVTLPALGVNDLLMPTTAVVTSSGQIAVLSRSQGSGNAFAIRTHVIDPATGSVQSALVGTYGGTPAPLVRLTDGRIVLAGTSSTRSLHGATGRPYAFHATLRTSSDGLTFSAPTELRPLGGDAQSVFSIAAAPGGGVLMGINDNALMSPGEVSFHPLPYNTSTSGLMWPRQDASNILSLAVVP